MKIKLANFNYIKKYFQKFVFNTLKIMNDYKKIKYYFLLKSD